MKHGEWRVGITMSSVQRKLWNVECGECGECRVGGVKCEPRTVERGVPSADCEAQRGASSVACEEGIAESEV